MTLAVALKVVAHDYVKERNAKLIDRYMEVIGRISALLIGTIAIEMIMVGGSSRLRIITAQP
jgi:small neutral amino acid transporter SnatA (MarC family)